MKIPFNIAVGLVMGVFAIGILGWIIMPKMMLSENEGPFGVDETVEKIKDTAVAEGWVVASVKPLH